MSIRTVKKIVKGTIQQDGAGVKLLRVLALDTVKEFDPFLMLDVFDSENPSDYIKGFPWHPHRGIETVTYLISGKIEHSDNLHNKGIIEDGCCQWMTAGSGIIHQEMPQPSKRMLGFQLWINIPGKDKMCIPRYHDINENSVPKIEGEGLTAKIISGHCGNTPGAFNGEYVKADIWDINMETQAEWSIETDIQSTVFIYIFNGYGYSGKDEKDCIKEKTAVLFNSGEEIRICSGKDGMRFIIFMGKPLKEPVAWGGPIVMNTNEELERAFKEIDNGTFIKNH
ncbi:MAG: pirin family protein [Clostridium sp.]|jgi:redox-sensitive bicupin YhaK (pirin superfamily)|uniref:pirin family protein n=1 Tax=Clostridium sp. TaxID=1506 RepID=UPI0025C7091D|nr:pirin family protein [Clostridium sp.]MCH3965214.1 pirin family protein [Clostridium sp.]MCI1714434.1 pirin family protein [Clostridium sp.]MCI1798696.1 pirin family protein [Clostridium sp.]MCI1812573.1 pirin family protein [Clostridium sp.]MCI1869506.1 pirin family protein [Clostridium sp.]